MSGKKCFCFDDETISEVTQLNDDETRFMLEPNINDYKNKNDQALCMLSKMMDEAIEDYDKVKPKNAHEDDNYKKPGDMNIDVPGEFNSLHEGFACDKLCSKNGNESFFEREETKYLLFIIAVLLLCGILFK